MGSLAAVLRWGVFTSVDAPTDVIAGLVPATPIIRHSAFLSGGVAMPHDRGRRDKPGDDGWGFVLLLPG
jgi:hypothetical protein